MTFLCNQVDHAHFYQTPHADFQAAVQPFTERAGLFHCVQQSLCLLLFSFFGLSCFLSIFHLNLLFLSSHYHHAPAGIPFQSFYQHHTTIHDTIKGRLTPQYMTEMCPVLSEKFYHHLNERGKKDEGDLMDFVRSVMFPAVVYQLFGQENIKLTEVLTVNALIVQVLGLVSKQNAKNYKTHGLGLAVVARNNLGKNYQHAGSVEDN